MSEENPAAPHADFSTPAARRVAIVIVNWNTHDMLRVCLDTLNTERASDFAEVVVVDNGSVDGSADMVAREFGDVMLVRNPGNRGFAAAVNQGFDRANGDYVLLLNSDTEVTPGAIGKSVEFLDAHPDVAVAGCRLRFPDGTAQSSCFREPSIRAVILNALYLAQLFPDSPVFNRDRYGRIEWDEVADVDCVMGSFMMVRRSAVTVRPLLDEGYFMYGEELDLTHRLRADGWRVVYMPDVTVVHHHGGSSRDPRVAAWANEAKLRAWLRFFMKWRGASIAWLVNLIMLLGALPRCVGWLISDMLAGVRTGKLLRANRLWKARALVFHVRALVRPSLFDTGWEVNDHAARTDHA